MFRRRKKSQEINRRRQPTYKKPTAKVFSYHSKRTIDTPRNTSRTAYDRPSKSKKTGIRWALLPSMVALIVIFGGVGKLLILDISPNVIIAGSESSKHVLKPASVYESKIRKILSKSVLNRFKPAVDTNKVAEEIKQEFPELSSVSIAIPIGGGKPIVQIRPNNPVFVLASFSGVFLVDLDGKVLTSASNEIIDAISLPTVTDESGLEVKAGTNAMPSSSALFIKSVIAQLESGGYSVESSVLPAIANELHVRLTGESYYIKYNMSGDVRLQTGAYVAVRKSLGSQNKKPAEYIDVRVPWRVFYR